MAKTLKITKYAIVVSANPLMDSGIYVEVKITGILPGCRKDVRLSYSPYAKRIVFRPMHGSSGVACIEPETFRKLLRLAPVVCDPLFPMEVTSEVINLARLEAEDICSCPAVTDMTHVHPSFKPEYDGISYSVAYPYVRPFKPGDRVSYCDEEATVVENYGNSGLVRFDDNTTCAWYWRFQGEAVILVKEAE